MKGGKREGAGRPKGSRNKDLSALIAGGLTPLEYMLSVVRDPSVEYDRRDKMAQAAAPYVHSRLATTEVKGNAESPIEHKLKIEFVRAGE